MRGIIILVVPYFYFSHFSKFDYGSKRTNDVGS